MKTEFRSESRKEKLKFSIIGIGTSAGGLDALKTFISQVPNDCRHAFVIIQHLSPDYKSLMAELLAKDTELPILEVRKTTPVETGSIYLIPPKKNLVFRKGMLLLTDKPQTRTLNLPVDIFFESLAAELKEEAISIILTGSGSDGTRGIRSVKEVGGMVMVQDPEQAQFSSMPQSAINTGLVDYILPVEDLAEELFNFIDNPSVETKLERRVEKDEEAFLRIMNLARSAINIDFSLYKRPTLVRRIVRRMGINKCFTPSEYLDFMYKNMYEAHLLSKEFLVGVTKFFRDDSAWDSIANQVLPDLIAQKTNENNVFKAWIAGCSTGEEAYSLAILVKEEIKKQGKDLYVKIFATDIQKESLDFANKGIYSESIVADVSPEHLTKYFTPIGGDYQVDSSLRKSVIFSTHDVLRDPPFSKLDIVICRNLLIYLKPTAQEKVLRTLHYSLNLNGVLFLGGSESTGIETKGLVPVDRKNKIFINKKPANPPSMGPIVKRDTWYQSNRTFRTRRNQPDPGMAEVLNETLADSWGIVAIYLDENHEILHASGEIKRYLEFPEKGFSSNFLRLVPSTLSIIISTSIRKAMSTGKAIKHEGFKFRRDKEVEIINISITPVKIAKTQAIDYFIVALIPQGKVEFSAGELDLPAESSAHLEKLENELKTARENLQATIEEVETSNEELQATNEELMAANEEMQSTNEELQSVNEELHTVNAEYQDKLEEVSLLNSEIENLIKSTQIGTVFLDKDMRIRKFTPAVQEHFYLQDQDIGRPLLHFASTFEGKEENSVIEEAKIVLRTGEKSEREIKTKEDLWFLRRITPYYSLENEISGVVLTFIEMNKLKATEEELKESKKFQDQILQTNPGLFYIYSLVEQRNIYVSKSITDILGYSPKDLKQMGDKIIPRLVHPDFAPKLVEHHQKVAQLDPNSEDYLTFVNKSQHRDGSWRWFRSQDRPFRVDEQGKVIEIIGTSIDITDLKEAEIALKQSKDYSDQIIQTSPGMVYIYDLGSQVNVYASKSIGELLGYTMEEIQALGDQLMAKVIHPEDIEAISQHYKQIAQLPEQEVANPTSLEYRVVHKNGDLKWFRSYDIPYKRDEQGKIIEIIGTVIDVSPYKQNTP